MVSGDGQRRVIDDRLEKLTPAQRKLLEQRLMQRRMEAAHSNAIGRRPGHGPAPLSYAQELLWLLSQVFDDGVAYNSPGAFQLKGKLDLDLLRGALRGLVERHEILRTTYSVIDGEPVQVIRPAHEIELNSIDLGALSPDEAYAEAQRILKEESRFPFDLVNGPVLRTTVIRLADDEHILMINMHHVCTDGYSRTVLYRELTLLYDALADGVEAPLAPLPIQYADYAVWQRDWLGRGVEDAQLSYWKDKLARAPSRLDLPNDFPRPPVRSYQGDQISMMLDLATRESLRSTARDGDATLFVALLSLFAELLHRYCGQDDIVIGTPFAGRNRSELAAMVGYFINPLALRIDLSGDPTFTELLARSRRTTLDAFAHADIPYETIVRAINPERDLSQTPVFQSMIVLHNPAWQTERPKFEPEGIRSTEITHEKGWAKFDVLLGMSERTTGLNTTWEYSTELFTGATVQRMMEHFRTLAESAANSPDRPLSTLTMLSPGERAKVLVSWNPRGELPQRQSVKELFEEQVARTPDATAVVFGDGRLTFDELNRRANRVAWLLRANGVGPGTLVGVLMGKSLDLLPAVVGVLKAGGAYIPLDPNYPPDRLEFMIADGQPRVLVTHEKHVALVPESAGTTLTIDSAGALESASEENPSTIAGADDLAYVIYTSGSTGKPKGVMIANRSIVSAFFAWKRAFRLDELTAHAQLASFSFDVFTGDMIRALLSGAKLVLCPIDVVVDPQALYDTMVREGVDAAEFVPATATVLFDYVAQEGKTLDFMRLIVVGSEAWRNDRYAAFKALCGPDTRLLNSYGLTEATIDSTWFEPADDADLVPGRFVPIGRPLDNTKVYILDRHLEPQPIGVAGELCVGGVAVARGYLNRPELTAERFVSDPFSSDSDARMYRTGDLARWLPDGSVDFIGRTDRQIKIRGFRIELGEIESVLEGDGAVHAAAVTDRTDDAGNPRLVAYLVAVDGEELPSTEALRALVAEHLPAYMIPSAWVAVDELPLGPSGKVDLDRLPDPEFDRSTVADEFVEPRTDIERVLAEVWSDVLAVDRVGINDNFFALGGHSLLAVRLFSEVEDRLGVRLPLAALFQSATVAGLAQIVERDREVEDQPWGPVMQLRKGADGPAFWLIPWFDGELLGYRDLIDNFPASSPLYGLTAPGLDGRTVPLLSIESMATYYLEEIRRIQPQGPYCFGGFCFAGVVAYEMGRQLAESGEEPGMVALIDSYYYGSRRPTRLSIERQKWASFRDADLRGKLTWSRRRVVRLRRRLRYEFYHRSGGLALDILSRVRRLHRPARPWNLMVVAAERANRRYRPPKSTVRIDFFRAQPGPEPDSSTVWDALAGGGVVLHPVIGPNMSHVTILKESGAPVLAREMAPVLAAVAARSHGSHQNGGPAGNGASAPVNGLRRMAAAAGNGMGDGNGAMAASTATSHPRART